MYVMVCCIPDQTHVSVASMFMANIGYAPFELGVEIFE